MEQVARRPLLQSGKKMKELPKRVKTSQGVTAAEDFFGNIDDVTANRLKSEISTL